MKTLLMPSSLGALRLLLALGAVSSAVLRANPDPVALQAEFDRNIQSIFADFARQNPNGEAAKMEVYLKTKKITGKAAAVLRVKAEERVWLISQGFPGELIDSNIPFKSTADTVKMPAQPAEKSADSPKEGAKALFQNYEQKKNAQEKADHSGAGKTGTNTNGAAATQTPSLEQQVDEAAQAIVDMHRDHPFKASDPVFIFHTGVRLGSPYQFRFDSTQSKGFVDKSGSSNVSGFAELIYAGRTAWSPEKLDRLLVKKRRPYDFFDLDARLGFDFANGGAKDASAVASSGDIDTQISLGLPLYGDLVGTPGAEQGGWTLGPEISLGLVTDRSAFDVRQRWFGGLAFASRQATSGDDTGLLILTRLGAGYIDSVEYINDSTQEVRVTHGDLPDYRMQWALALESDLIYPLGNTSKLTLGGRIYDGPKPNTWMFYFGYSVDPKAVAAALFPAAFKSTPAPAAADTTSATK